MMRKGTSATTERATMEVIAKLTRSESTHALDFFNCTKHVHERMGRIERNGLGLGSLVSGYLVDNKHPMGLEEHFVTTSGLVIIRNHNTKKAVTILVARPEQICRYYRPFHERAPRNLIDIAIRNVEMGYNLD